MKFKMLKEEIMKNNKVPKNDNPPKEIFYDFEYEMYIAICPNCGDIPYDKEVCQLCGQKLIWKEKPKKYQDIVVEKDGYRATQIYGSWSIYIENKNQLLTISKCTRRFTKKELLKMIEKVKDGKKNESK